MPRCACEEHKVAIWMATWTEPGSLFTLKVEAVAVHVILAIASLPQAEVLLSLNPDSAIGVDKISQNSVANDLNRIPRFTGSAST